MAKTFFGTFGIIPYIDKTKTSASAIFMIILYIYIDQIKL